MNILFHSLLFMVHYVMNSPLNLHHLSKTVIIILIRITVITKKCLEQPLGTFSRHVTCLGDNLHDLWPRRGKPRTRLLSQENHRLLSLISIRSKPYQFFFHLCQPQIVKSDKYCFHFGDKCCFHFENAVSRYKCCDSWVV